eukprot:1863410-Rhodomonas_salina.3
MLGLVGAHDVLVPGRRKRKGAGFRTEAPAVVVGLGGLFDDDMEDHEEGCLQHDACIPSHATSVPRVGSVRVVCSTMPAYNHAKLSAAHQRTFAISASRIQEHPTLASSVPRIEADRAKVEWSCRCKRYWENASSPGTELASINESTASINRSTTSTKESICLPRKYIIIGDWISLFGSRISLNLAEDGGWRGRWKLMREEVSVGESVRSVWG